MCTASLPQHSWIINRECPFSLVDWGTWIHAQRADISIYGLVVLLILVTHMAIAQECCCGTGNGVGAKSFTALAYYEVILLCMKWAFGHYAFSVLV